MAERDAAVKRADRVAVEAQAAVEQHRCACVRVFIYIYVLPILWVAVEALAAVEQYRCVRVCVFMYAHTVEQHRCVACVRV